MLFTLKNLYKIHTQLFLTCNLIGRGSNVEFVIVTITEDKFSADDYEITLPEVIKYDI